MGSGKERSNTRRPGLGETTVATAAGSAVVSCDIEATVPVTLLTEIPVPAACLVAVVRGDVALVLGDEVIGTVLDPALADRLATCIARRHQYSATIRRQGPAVVADIIGG